jgi:D-alanyl-D-alanine carboxypeptidase
VIVVALLVIVTVVVVKVAGPKELAAVAGTGAPSAPASAAASVQPTAPPSPTATVAPASASAAPPAPAGFDKTRYSIDDPNSIWFVVNKLRPIPDGENFVPPNLVDLPAGIPNPNHYQMRGDAEQAMATMFDAAKAEINTQLVAQSGYRDYGVQVDAYHYYVNLDGVAGADQTSARPGYSEHQTGLAMDILDTTSGCSTDGLCFSKTTAGQWLAANAYRFGFLLRYPADKTAVTGYEYEPWHFRYIGVDLATEMHNTGVETLEEFFGLPPAPDYAG